MTFSFKQLSAQMGNFEFCFPICSLQFESFSFINRYTPQIKDFVHITAIESHAGGLEFSLRAISVIPSSNNLRSSAQNCSLLTISNRENLRDTSGEIFCFCMHTFLIIITLKISF